MRQEKASATRSLAAWADELAPYIRQSQSRSYLRANASVRMNWFQLFIRSLLLRWRA